MNKKLFRSMCKKSDTYTRVWLKNAKLTDEEARKKAIGPALHEVGGSFKINTYLICACSSMKIFKRGSNTVLTLEAIGSIRCSPEVPPWWVLRRCRGLALRVVPAGRGWSGAAQCWAGAGGGLGGGGDSEREVARRESWRRREGGGEEGEAATGRGRR